MNKRILIILSIIILIGCTIEKRSVIKIINNSTGGVITVFTNKNIRYVIAGDVNVLPKNNYVKLDIKNVNFNYDSFFGCFEDDKWILINPDSKILENKLNSDKYHFSTKKVFEKSEVIKFHTQDKCFEFTTSEMSIYGDNNIKILKSFSGVKKGEK
ncbi:hypothetical protein AAON49_00130 [Pseudotenacibaculum sp. MALMAid0570]|uniref:hypothetical protein n=1 Tax=Pseudotenacibaculum sp. MALMAid0570 TaxID=3143938 RepID=UPI0032DF3E0F